MAMLILGLIDFLLMFVEPGKKMGRNLSKENKILKYQVSTLVFWYTFIERSGKSIQLFIVYWKQQLQDYIFALYFVKIETWKDSANENKNLPSVNVGFLLRDLEMTLE